MTQYKDDKQKIAVALEYNKNKTLAPKVVASGHNNIDHRLRCRVTVAMAIMVKNMPCILLAIL